MGLARGDATARRYGTILKDDWRCKSDSWISVQDPRRGAVAADEAVAIASDEAGIGRRRQRFRPRAEVQRAAAEGQDELVALLMLLAARPARL